MAAVGDVSEMDVAEGLVRTALERWGKLDILCCRPRHPARADDLQHDRGRVGRVDQVAPERVLRTDEVRRDPLAPGAAGRPHHLLHVRRGDPRQQRAAELLGGARGQARPDALERARPEPLRRDEQLASAPGASDTHDRPGSGDGRARARRPALPQRGRPATPRTWRRSRCGWRPTRARRRTGKPSGARGHVITLYSEPERERLLRFEEPFIDIDELFELWPETLGSEPLERTQAWT